MSMVGRINMQFTLQDESVNVGAISGAWEDVNTFWGKLNAIKSSEGVTHNLVLRYFPNFCPKVGQRALYNGKAYLICKVDDPTGDKRWLSVQVKEEEYLN